ncbi:hypothetical protein BDW68DRAFT_158131 [Aspergillus falconensis]
MSEPVEGYPAHSIRAVEELAPQPSGGYAFWQTARNLLHLLQFGSPTSPDRDPAVVRKLDRT